MLNTIIIMGRLTKDPELRQVGETQVCSFRIACDRDFKGKDGEAETDFVDIVAWRKLAENVEKYFTKGRMAIIKGRLQIRNWEDKEGNKRTSAEIVADNVYFSDAKPKEQEQAPAALPADFVPDFSESADDELPFNPFG